jgi:hypothetical protein
LSVKNIFWEKTTDFSVFGYHLESNVWFTLKEFSRKTFSVGKGGSGGGWCRWKRGWPLGCTMVRVFVGRGISIEELWTKNVLCLRKKIYMFYG